LSFCTKDIVSFSLRAFRHAASSLPCLDAKILRFSVTVLAGYWYSFTIEKPSGDKGIGLNSQAVLLPCWLVFACKPLGESLRRWQICLMPKPEDLCHLLKSTLQRIGEMLCGLRLYKHFSLLSPDFIGIFYFCPQRRMK